MCGKNDFGALLGSFLHNKIAFLLQFWFYTIICGFSFFFGLVFGTVLFNVYAFLLFVDTIFDICICRVTLEMTELVQLIFSWSDSELEMLRYGMKKNTLTVDPIMNCERDNDVITRAQTIEVGFLKTELRKRSFWFWNFEVGSIWFFDNWYPTFA